MTVLCVLSPLSFGSHGTCCNECGGREFSIGGDPDGPTTTASVALGAGGGSERVLVHRTSVIFTPALKRPLSLRPRRLTQTTVSPSISALDRDVSTALLSSHPSAMSVKQRSVSVGTCESSRTLLSFSQSVKFHHTSTELHDLDLLEREEEGEEAKAGVGDALPPTPPPSPPCFEQLKVFKEEHSPSPGIEEVVSIIEDTAHSDSSVQIPMIDSVHESNQCET